MNQEALCSQFQRRYAIHVRAPGDKAFVNPRICAKCGEPGVLSSRPSPCAARQRREHGIEEEGTELSEITQADRAMALKLLKAVRSHIAWQNRATVSNDN